MKRMLAIFLAAVLFLDVVCAGVLFFTSAPSDEESGGEDFFTKASVVAVGSNLIQNELLIQAKDRSNTGGYDFSMVYENLKPLVSQADVAIVTQPGVISSGHTVSGELRYNAPPELGDELVKTGFDVINIATDHILDYGEEGLINTVEYWKEKPDVTAVGVYENSQDASALTMTQVNGIKFAYVSFTQGTGGNSLPENSEAVVSLAASETELGEKISFAKRKADVVIVCANWGSEFDTEVTDDMREFAAKLAEWGADVIIGTHPSNVLEAEYIQVKDRAPAFVVYSLGNVVSCSTQPNALLSGILTFDVVKNKEERTVSVENFGISGSVLHYGMNMSKIRLYPLDEYTGELASLHGINDSFDGFGVRYLNNILTDTYDKKLIGRGK